MKIPFPDDFLRPLSVIQKHAFRVGMEFGFAKGEEVVNMWANSKTCTPGQPCEHVRVATTMANGIRKEAEHALRKLREDV